MRRGNPGQLIVPVRYSNRDENGLPAPTPAERLHEVSNSAKQLNRNSNTKPARPRYGWGDDEVMALLENIAEYGTRYAYIKATDAKTEKRLLNRTAEDLRFKSRDLKVQYVKAQYHRELHWG